MSVMLKYWLKMQPSNQSKNDSNNGPKDLDILGDPAVQQIFSSSGHWEATLGRIQQGLEEQLELGASQG